MALPPFVTRVLDLVFTRFVTDLLVTDPIQHSIAWRELAQRRGGTCNEPGGRANAVTPPDSVDIRTRHAEVRVDLIKDPMVSRTHVTRAQSRYLLGSGPAFEVSPAGVLSGLGQAFGTSGPELGEAAFDGAFAIRGRDHAGIKALWTLPLQQLLTQRLPRASVWSDGTHVRVTVAGVVEDPARLEAMVDIVGSLASPGASEFHALADLPRATLTLASGTWEKPSAPRLSITTAHGDATATLRWIKSGPRVWLSMAPERDLPPFRVVVRNGQAAGIPVGMLGEHVTPWLEALDGVLLLSEAGTLHLRWLGIPTKHALLAGVAVLEELAAGRHRVGAFR